MDPLTGKTVCILVDNLYNDFEFWIPYYRMKEAGAEVVVAGPKAGGTYTGKAGLEAKADKAFGQVDAASLDGLIIPGGYAPDIIRRDVDALALVRAVDEAGKTLAFICHAGWVPISAGVVKGRTLTSYFAIKDDLVNAGADWVDAEVVEDGNFVTSRTPDDLPAFNKAVIANIAG